MITLDQRVISAALQWCQSGQAVWLCTVLRTYGSSPRAKGTIMAVNSVGQYCGSLSGGCIEEDFLAQLASGNYRECSRVIRYGEGGMRPDVQLPCGGSLDILIEYLPADTQSFSLLQAMQQALAGETQLVKRVVPGGRSNWSPIAVNEQLPSLEYDGQQIILPVGSVPELLIAGYSTVAFECIRLGQILGYHVRVCEHRPEMLEELELCFNGADNISIVPQHPARWLELYGAHASVAIVSLTHDPSIDELTIMEAINTSAFYIGVMGSARNSEKRNLRLQRIGGMKPDEIERIKAPIGLKIGSKTPAEIALSVMADIVKTRNGV